jgi:hypothetical protein
VLAEFQRVMAEHMAQNPGMESTITRGRAEEPVVLQKPTTATVLNTNLAELLGLTTLPMIRSTVQVDVESTTESKAAERDA